MRYTAGRITPFFEPMDKYFTPFLNPNPKGKFSRQEWNEILPENNEGMYTVPQILTNRAEDSSA